MQSTMTGHTEATAIPATALLAGRAMVLAGDGTLLRLYHGSAATIDKFDPSKTVDGGLHFGTLEQASTRAHGEGQNIIPVYLEITKLRRCADEGGGWRQKIAAAKRSGCDGIVYLNRYEGIPQHRFDALNEAGMLDKLDDLSDAAFKKLVPEARDSYIAFSAKQVHSVFALRAPVPAPARSLLDLRNEWKSKGVDNYVGEGRDGTLNLSQVIVQDKKARGNGLGSAFMEDLIAYADAKGARLTLTPSTDYGASSVARLKAFYKRFGFVENKGRYKDYTVSEGMYRPSVQLEAVRASTSAPKQNASLSL